MAFDGFLKIDGVDGESTDSKHSKWIEIHSFHHHVSQPTGGSGSSGSARAGERVNIGDFSVVKSIGKDSPKLNLHCCNGKHFSEVTIELCRSTGDKQAYLKYTLSDVLITHVRIGGSAKEGHSVPVEEIGFAPGKFEITYTATDPKTGKASGDVKMHWSVNENKGG